MRRALWTGSLLFTLTLAFWLAPGTTLGGIQAGDGPRVVTFALIEFVPHDGQHWHREPLRFSGCWSYERPVPGGDSRPWHVRVRTTDGVDREFAVPDRAVTVCESVAHLPAGTTAARP